MDHTKNLHKVNGELHSGQFVMERYRVVLCDMKICHNFLFAAR